MCHVWTLVENAYLSEAVLTDSRVTYLVRHQAFELDILISVMLLKRHSAVISEEDSSALLIA